MTEALIAGVGLRRGCPADDIVAVVQAAVAAVGRPVSLLAAPSFKRQETGLTDAAERLDLTILLVEDAALQEAQPRCVTHSAAAARAVGFASVAEASALAVAGYGGRLVLPRIGTGRATCAIAARA